MRPFSPYFSNYFNQQFGGQMPTYEQFQSAIPGWQQQFPDWRGWDRMGDNPDSDILKQFYERFQQKWNTKPEPNPVGGPNEPPIAIDYDPNLDPNQQPQRGRQMPWQFGIPNMFGGFGQNQPQQWRPNRAFGGGGTPLQNVGRNSIF